MLKSDLIYYIKNHYLFNGSEKELSKMTKQELTDYLEVLEMEEENYN